MGQEKKRETIVLEYMLGVVSLRGLEMKHGVEIPAGKPTFSAPIRPSIYSR